MGHVVGQVAVFVVVAGCEVDAEGRGEFAEGSGHAEQSVLTPSKKSPGMKTMSG
jgi:hypothetical protein